MKIFDCWFKFIVSTFVVKLVEKLLKVKLLPFTDKIPPKLKKIIPVGKVIFRDDDPGIITSLV